MKSTSEPIYDYIFAGAGAAGLSLTYFLLQTSLSSSRILIIDKDEKDKNDRTWCFWTKEKTGLEEIIYRKWDRVIFKNKMLAKELDIYPYQYQMIRGLDFYQYVKKCISKFPNVKWVKAEVTEITSNKDQAIVNTKSYSFKGKMVFNSLPIPKPTSIPKKKNFLLQHFKGKIIETEEKSFNPALPYLMDFSVDQAGETRFGYVLPFSEKQALVEFTLFSPELLAQKEYESLLSNYLHTQLNIDTYSVIEEEFGVIPMTDIDFTFNPTPLVYHIGTIGGMTKASTGYTFKRILDETKLIVKQLESGKKPMRLSNRKFRFFDSVFLHVLAENFHPADEIFSDLFLKNTPDKILKFLDEETTLSEDLKILYNLPTIPFLKGAFKTFYNPGVKNITD